MAETTPPPTPVPDSLTPEGLMGPTSGGSFYGPLSAVPDESWMVRDAHGGKWVWKRNFSRYNEDRVVQARRRSFKRGEIVHYPQGATLTVLAEAFDTLLWVVPVENYSADRVFTAWISEVALGPRPTPSES